IRDADDRLRQHRARITHRLRERTPQIEGEIAVPVVGEAVGNTDRFFVHSDILCSRFSTDASQVRPSASWATTSGNDAFLFWSYTTWATSSVAWTTPSECGRILARQIPWNPSKRWLHRGAERTKTWITSVFLRLPWTSCGTSGVIGCSLILSASLAAFPMPSGIPPQASARS